MLLGIGSSLSLLLVAMALGYLVCIKANKEQGFLRALGIVLGAIIIIVTFLFAVGLITIVSLKSPAITSSHQQFKSARPMLPPQPQLPNK